MIRFLRLFLSYLKIQVENYALQGTFSRWIQGFVPIVFKGGCIPLHLVLL